MFDPQKFIDEQVEKTRSEVKGKAIIAASGGVDSTVCAVIASRALGDQLIAVYVDTGFMRKGETKA
ncbi:MAG: glutamine-hydrolyzing GMP synthase subunit GuaA, partial [Thermoplasmata archaeon]